MDPLPGGSGAKHYPILLQKGAKSYRDFKSSQKFSAKIGKRRNTHMTYKTFTRKKALPAKEPRQCLFPDVSMFCKGYASFKRDPLKADLPEDLLLFPLDQKSQHLFYFHLFQHIHAEIILSNPKCRSTFSNVSATVLSGVLSIQ